jgi:hypothetical protein
MEIATVVTRHPAYKCVVRNVAAEILPQADNCKYLEVLVVRPLTRGQ